MENDIRRIADALEQIAKNSESWFDRPWPHNKKSYTQAELHAPSDDWQAIFDKADDTPTPPKVTPTPPKVTPTPPKVTPMTMKELNSILFVEFNRLKSRGPIDKAFQAYGVASIRDLKQEDYQSLIDTVKAL